MHIIEHATERHTLSITVTNESGVLAKIAGMFSARGYNIESLTVADISPENDVSRITIVTNGTPHVIEQIVAQLDRMVLVHRVADLTEGAHFECELALVRLADAGGQHDAALSLAEEYHAQVIDAEGGSFVFEATATSGKLDSFIVALSALGTVEVARSGIVAISRG
jgi:acetolactate synthase-1/3 small subunit